MKVLCPKCLEESAVKLDLADGDTLTCPECEEEFSAEKVRVMVAGWAKLLPLLDPLANRLATAEVGGGN